MNILTFENFALIIMGCSVLLAIGMTVFNLPKILSKIFLILLIVIVIVLASSEVLFKNAVSTESRTEIQEVISKESITTVEYKDLEGNTQKTFISGIKTSDEYIPYSYIETKTYSIGFFYKDVNTLYLKK